MADSTRTTRFRFWRWLIAFIGVIVPRRFRARWQQEWEAELEHREAMLARWDRLNWRNKLELLWRSLGAFLDALWLQRQRLEEDMFQDLRFGMRVLLKNPGFTTVAVLTLALGIGANTAIFSLVNAVLLRQLPFPDSRQLMVIWAHNPSRPGQAQTPPANADIAEWRGQNGSFAKLAAFSPGSADLADGGDPERFGAAGVTAGFFETLGVTPLLGRTIAPDEEAYGGPPVALISYGLWQRRFGGDPALLGKEVSINGGQRTIIGILPPNFDFPRGAEWPASFSFAGRTEVWLPLALRPQDDGSGWSHWQSRNERGLIAVGRLKPEASPRQAQSEMDVFAARRASDHADTHKDVGIKLIPLREQLAGKSQTPLLMLFAAASLLLLIACVNVANLLLARGVARHQELAVRAALGAGSGRLARQLLTECLLLALLGCGLGLLVAEACLKTFLALNPLSHSRLDEAAIDPAMLGFTALVGLVTSAVFGLIPAIQASKTDLRGALHEGSRGSEGVIRERVRGSLVGAQVALALVMLMIASLMVRSFLRVQAVQPGFRPDSVLAFDVQLNKSYANSPGQLPFFERLVARLEALPGVRSAGAISYLPLGGGENRGSFIVEGEPEPAPGSRQSAERRWVTPGYFKTMGIPLRQGRSFTPGDNADQPRVAIINETMARKYFNNRDPLGRQLRALGAWRTVVGVVSDVKSASLEREVNPQLYLPSAQVPWGVMTIVVHTEGDPLALAPAARNELKSIAPLLPAAKMRTMEQVLSGASGERRFNMALLAFFAVAALLLTVVGIFGVVSFLVSRRSREIGIRIALGAQRHDVIRLILQQGMKPVMFGVVAGLAGSWAASRLVASQLYGVSAWDPLALTSAIALLGAAALLACYLPARRAAKGDPMVALRRD